MAELTIEHLGRITRATVRGSDAQLKKFRNALLLKEFRIVAEQENAWELRRRAYLLQDDWPVQVKIRRNGAQFEIDYYLSIPRGWIAGLGFFTFALPFAGLQNAGLAFVLALLVMGLAVYKQKFDGRPDARFWQQRSRQRWGELMERLMRDVFECGPR
ncbi:MAG TPA: hypothetical protein DCS21_00395 [Gammaproteobacteria bacterium]|nr:hypothetical protein [Gammaproteobacteria bacterium]